MPRKDIIKVFIALIRTILEYACQLRHSSFTIQQTALLESIQQRAFKTAFPGRPYKQALLENNILSLSDPHNELCKDLFLKMQNPNHKLHCLLPTKRDIKINLPNPKLYDFPCCFTDRYKNSFVPYSLPTFNNVSKIYLFGCFNSDRCLHSFVPVLCIIFYVQMYHVFIFNRKIAN